MKTTRRAAKGKASKKTKRGPKSGFLNIRNKELRIKYSNSHDLLDKLQTVSQSLSRLHSHQLMAQGAGAGATLVGDALDHLSTSDIPDVLGPERATTIVTECA